MTDSPAPAANSTPDEYAPADVEHKFHNYRGNRIPWYVRLIWLGFWIMAIYYVVQWTFPTLQYELTSPP
jgi:hypothetical protein